MLALRRCGGVRRLPEKLDLGHREREPLADVDLVQVVRMPGQDHVRVLERAGAQHEGLARQDLLGRRAEDLNRSREPSVDTAPVGGDGRRDRRGAEQIVPAPVAGGCVRERGRLHLARPLGEAGKRVVLRQDCDDRGTRARAGDERRRHSPNAPFHLEAFAGQSAREERSRAMLSERRLCQIPDLSGYRLPPSARRIQVRVCCSRLLRAGDAGETSERKHPSEKEKAPSHQGGSYHGGRSEGSVNEAVWSREW
jgi:hypothetical protein